MAKNSTRMMQVMLVGIIWSLSNGASNLPHETYVWRNLDAQFYTMRGNNKVKPEAVLTNSGYFVSPMTGWLVGTNGKWLGESRGMIANTEDGGKTWKVQYDETPSQLSQVFFSSTRTGWIVGSEQSRINKSQGLLMATSDGGKSWQKRPIANYERSDFSAITFRDADTGFIAGGIESEGSRSGIVLRTSDGGGNWSTVSSRASRGMLRDVKFDSTGQFGWAVGDEGSILRSVDYGMTWHSQKPEFSGTLSRIAVLSSSEAWVTGSDFSLLHTDDGGRHWKVVSPKPIGSKVENSGAWFSGILFQNGKRGWVGGTDGLILITSDGGQSWQLEATGSGDFVYQLCAANGSIIAVSKDGTLLKRQVD